MYRFIGHESWRNKLPPFEFDQEIIKYEEQNKLGVTVLRKSLFFYAGEKTTLERIRVNFTDFAINKLVHDKFIKIHD